MKDGWDKATSIATIVSSVAAAIALALVAFELSLLRDSMSTPFEANFQNKQIDACLQVISTRYEIEFRVEGWKRNIVGPAYSLDGTFIATVDMDFPLATNGPNYYDIGDGTYLRVGNDGSTSIVTFDVPIQSFYGAVSELAIFASKETNAEIREIQSVASQGVLFRDSEQKDKVSASEAFVFWDSLLAASEGIALRCNAAILGQTKGFV